MRDFSQRLGTNHLVNTKEPQPTCLAPYEYTVSNSYVSFEQARSEVLHSDGHAPTAYNAYRIERFPVDVFYYDLRSKRLCYPREYYHETYQGHYVQNLWVQLKPQAPTHFPSVSENVRNACKAQLLNKLGSEVNLGQTLGEIPGTAQQMFDQVKSGLKGLNSLRKGDFAGAMQHFGATVGKGYKQTKGRRAARAASNSYLAAKYGWFPIMRDVYNIHSSIMKFMTDQEQAFIDVSATHVEGAGPFIFGSTVFSGKAQQGYQMGVRYTVSNGALAGLNSTGLINPLSLAWELLPMSFVFDWFVDAGSFLSGLSAPLGMNFLHGYETKFVRTDGELVDLTKSIYPYSGKSSFRVKEFGMARQAIYTWPKPGLYVRVGLNPSQILTLAALYAQGRT